MSNFSKDSKKLKNLLDEVIHRFPSVICFLTDKDNKIISQSITDDITPRIINELYSIIADLLNTKGNVDVSEKLKYIDSGTNILTLVTHTFETSDNPVKNVLIFSKIFDRDVVMHIKDEIILKIQKTVSNR